MTSGAFSARFEPNQAAKTDRERDEILADPGFGTRFTDHMFLADWTADSGWQDPRVVPYGPLSVDPSAAVLHYAQEIFEGLKAFRQDDGSLALFRPDQNAARMQRSAERLALPSLPTDWFIGSVESLLDVDGKWTPGGAETSLYLRPFMFASEAFLGVRPTATATYAVIASPAGAYFKTGFTPMSLWLSEHYSRAGAGGTGAAKCGGNYASSLLPQREAIENGCEQVVFLDSIEHTYIEELGGMNIFFVQADGSIVTPELSGSILEGITRASLIQIARDLGHEVSERRVTIEQWRTGVADGSITEVFACGTAATVVAVGALKSRSEELVWGDSLPGKVTTALRSSLIDIQYGRAEDRHGWMRSVRSPGQALGV